MFINSNKHKSKWKFLNYNRRTMMTMRRKKLKSNQTATILTSTQSYLYFQTYRNCALSMEFAIVAWTSSGNCSSSLRRTVKCWPSVSRTARGWSHYTSTGQRSMTTSYVCSSVRSWTIRTCRSWIWRTILFRIVAPGPLESSWMHTRRLLVWIYAIIKFMRPVLKLLRMLSLRIILSAIWICD